MGIGDWFSEDSEGHEESIATFTAKADRSFSDVSTSVFNNGRAYIIKFNTELDMAITYDTSKEDKSSIRKHLGSVTGESFVRLLCPKASAACSKYKWSPLKAKRDEDTTGSTS